MRLANRAAYAAGIIAVALSATLSADDQAVTFSDIHDAVPSRFFDAATTAPDPGDPNRLIIGFNAGMDWSTWKATDFRASTAAYSYGTAMDTIKFKVAAPPGYYISKITYTQHGTGYVYRTGKASGAANWVVGDFAGDLGVFGTNPSLSWTMDLSDRYLTEVPVSISNSLFAFSTPYLGAASVAATSAEVRVEVRSFTE